MKLITLFVIVKEPEQRAKRAEINGFEHLKFRHLFHIFWSFLSKKQTRMQAKSRSILKKDIEDLGSRLEEASANNNTATQVELFQLVLNRRRYIASR